MIDLEKYLYNKVKPVITKWDEKGIYAISFFVYSNEVYGILPIFSISYNTEEDCNYAGRLSEKRWNYAFWKQNEHNIIGDHSSSRQLMRWLLGQGIKNIGIEDEKTMYDKDMGYIGKGPSGYYELLQVVSKVALRLHNEGIIKDTFGKSIPIIIHNLDYSWYCFEATKNGNPSEVIESFLEAYTNGFSDDK